MVYNLGMHKHLKMRDIMKERYGLPDKVLDMFPCSSKEMRAEAVESEDKADEEIDTQNIYVYGPLDTEDWRVLAKKWFADDTVMSSIYFKYLLDKMENNFSIHINSPGGYVYEGAVINSLLKQTTKSYNIVIDGLCFSAATFFLSPNINVAINELGQIGIHRSWQFAMGNANDLKAAAKDLEDYDNTIMDYYMKRMTDVSRKDLIKMMDDVTYFSAEEAVKNGLADKLIEDNQEKKAEKDKTDSKKARLSGLAAIAASSLARQTADDTRLVN